MVIGRCDFWGVFDYGRREFCHDDFPNAIARNGLVTDAGVCLDSSQCSIAATFLLTGLNRSRDYVAL